MTSVEVHQSDANAVNWGAELASIDEARVRITNATGTAFAYCKVTAVTGPTSSVYTLTVTVLFSVGTFTNAESVAVSLERDRAKGTTFPSGPQTYDRFLRTDRGIEYFYDGTRWLSLQEYDFGAGQQVSAGATGITASPSTVVRWAVRSDYELWLTRWVVHSRVLTTNNGSNNWTVALTYQVANATATTITSFGTSADTAGNLTNHDQAINAALNTSAEGVSTTVTINAGAPGGIFAPSQLLYRLIG